MKWFHSLKIAHKLTLVSVFFMIPDSIMLYLFITSINQNITVARLEQTGNEYQRAVEPLLDLIPQHRLLVRPDPALRDAHAIAAIQTQIDSAFTKLAAVDGRIGQDLDFTPEGLSKRNREACALQRVRDAWTKVRLTSQQPTGEAADQAHLELVANIRAMISHAGDTSNLILDPELDSYYLMDTTLLALPQTQDRLTQIIVDGVQRLRSPGAAHEEKVTLAIDLAFLQHDDLERIANSIQTTLNNGNPDYGPNPELQQRIPPLLNDYTKATRQFAGMIAKLQAADTTGLSETEFMAAGKAARDASFALWYAADTELDHLLQRRVDYFVYHRARSLAVAACAVLAAALLVTFITRSISGPLKKQAADLRVACLEAEAERKLAEDRLILQQRAEAELRAAQDQLVTASRHAGMAEVATGVLHNVGNVLNSVNVSVHLIKDKVQGSNVVKLTRTADLLDQHEQDLGTFLTSDAKGKLIPGYVSKLARLLGGENASVMLEIDNLSRGIDHIKQVVQFQQSYAKPSTLRETVNPADLLDDALRLNLIALDRHGVTINRDIGEVGLVKIDKHKTLQILVNLISNAKNAMKDLNDNKERCLSLSLSMVSGAGEHRLRIAIKDNGVGIAAEHLSRIFEHGFTTRPEGHGFGLHSAINAAREMGGSLDVFSAGAGQGATFTLDIPTEPSEVSV
ncbi:MAG: putative two-component sensor histidine kinase [Phycisphaerales bacterium]|nr:putative two-component sensor histidine kinase [Phycisphaerales bacterium]